MMTAVVENRIDIKVLSTYKNEVEIEWNNILAYWIKYTVDHENGGFYGSVNNNNVPDVKAPKGIVLCSRILWTFSTAYNKLQEKKYLLLADRAYNYIINNFIDNQFGGVYWSVDNKGQLLNGKKQIYGLAFCIYGISEYYRATQNKAALDCCLKLFNYIEAYSFDKINGGYLEAFTRDWKSIDDFRLSDKDDNQKKTMNTHLHIIEAYANLYSVFPDEVLQRKIVSLLSIFEKNIINKKTFHLNLFFDENWTEKSSLISFGHDIEAAWLLLECAEIIGNTEQIEKYKTLSIKMANAAVKGLDTDGALWYEYNTDKHHWIKEKHNWPQAEAMVGFLNAYQITEEKKYLHQSIKSWQFINANILDKQNGEWYWGINEDYTIMQNQDKAGFWKCPYHNTRACVEVINRIEKIIKS